MSKGRYEYKGNLYEVIDETCRKCTETDQWLPVVIYKSLKDGNVYVRDMKDFYMKFNEVYQFTFPTKHIQKFLKINL